MVMPLPQPAGPWPQAGGGNSLSGSYSRSDGYSRNRAGGLNADYSGGKAFWRGGYASGQLKADWHAGMSLKGYGSNTFYGASWDDQYERTLQDHHSPARRDARRGVAPALGSLLEPRGRPL